MDSKGLSHSPVITKEKKSEKRKPTKEFPCENQDGDSIGCVSRKSSRDPSLAKAQIKLGDSEESDLVADLPPEPVTKKRRSQSYTGRKSYEELDAVDCPEMLCSGSEEADKIHLHNVNAHMLKALEEGDAPACGEKHVSLATSAKENMKKGIWKKSNAQTKTVVKTIGDKSANEDCECSSQVTWSVLCDSESSKDEATTERPYMKIKTEESQRIGENGDDDSLDDSTYSLSRKENEITWNSSSGHSSDSSEDSESDDPLEECLRIFEEYEKKQKEACHQQAMAEEQCVFDSCSSKISYQNYAARTLSKLREHEQCSNSESSGDAGPKMSEVKKAFTDSVLYELLKDYILTKNQLNENNFPQPNPKKRGSAIFPKVVKHPPHDDLKRLCCRCGVVYAVSSSGEHTHQEECIYHPGKVVEQKVPGEVEKHYSCCKRPVGSAGCQIAMLHVHDGRSDKMEGFMKTVSKSLPCDGTFGVYALDCEVCYTTHGLELIRVTVVDAALQVVYDTFVKPDGKIIDYNQRLSAVTENDLKTTTTSLRNVQAVLLNLFNADTILIGHALEKSFTALKLIHNTVVDVSVVFPHHLGLPNKRTLQNLVSEYLRRIHPEDDVNGHNSKEDAIACMELILWKIKEDNKNIE